ncbi:MAG: 2-oxoacid:acceptor oxidoreductase family protein [Deltaproteobacteria bacterium]|nr:2-oxoacid:acceptor oxidoreductase family protein [Deltaproteobacteria bacterium]MBW2596381.1 2-oxoacid:acceptor oxidoreductase family protein [Deltaproteobacteria bacterium]MBW2649773.1 2-oxoacid:acceptor oxidoreductase family protein [Deltaproteobacteria bacterium]
MIEIRFHGRGGQGAVIGSEVLARAFFNEGKYVQSFPAFGVERRGAPIMAFCRVDDSHINLRNQIYEPDHVVVLDAALIETAGVTQGLKKGGSIVVNCGQDSNCFSGLVGNGYQLYGVDASSIAREYRLGSPSNPIVNTSILGAFAKATGLVKIESVEQAIEEYIPFKREDNKKAARAAYEQTVKK